MISHEVVVLYRPFTPNVVLVDFAPVNGNTAAKLLLNYTVPGKIRVKHIRLPFVIMELTMRNKREIKKRWIQYLEETTKSKNDYDFCTMVLLRYLNWNLQMNLYKNNCKHFTREFIKIFDS
jgi:hypothetical protein